ncbi:MAG TPA: quaternary ammonium compound-resistance protein SugE [Elusimicrobia bacterium]|nr:quaternary ammonium compound-resistance protein SugE [Elusimicrobiota bacterium]
MAWVYLAVAGLLEIVWALSLKHTHGWSRLGPSVLTVFGIVASLFFLAQAARTIPIGTSYAVWTGIGALGTAALGILFYEEPATPARFACIALIVAGIVGLKLTSR